MRSSLAAILVAVGTGTAAITLAPGAHADQIGYLVNVHARPGYTFADAQAALDYGYGVCDRVAANTHFADLVNQVDADLDTSDQYQSTYLIGQAVDQLCPADLWQLRQSVNTR
jgi:Protein of unknown function (DUF732)